MALDCGLYCMGLSAFGMVFLVNFIIFYHFLYLWKYFFGILNQVYSINMRILALLKNHGYRTFKNPIFKIIKVAKK